jgi:hypothetical protein
MEWAVTPPPDMASPRTGSLDMRDTLRAGMHLLLRNMRLAGTELPRTITTWAPLAMGLQSTDSPTRQAG